IFQNSCLISVRVFLFCFVFVFLRWSLALSPSLGCNGRDLGSLQPRGSSNSPASASQVAGTTGARHHAHHHARLIFVVLVEMGFHHVGQAGPELLTSDHLSALASQRAGITGMSRHAWLRL
uniref:Uncharacterized protein n=1 Tax=Macaca mulatta TaxID=9544 RepID=A0A5F7ZDX1_MACMU